MSTVIDAVMQKECPQGNLKLRPQQCWLIQDEEGAYVAEVLAFQGLDTVIGKLVTLLTRRKHKGKIVTEYGSLRMARMKNLIGRQVVIHPSSYTRGEGSNCKVPTELLIDSRLRVIMGCDQRNQALRLHRLICGVIPEIPVRSGAPHTDTSTS